MEVFLSEEVHVMLECAGLCGFYPSCVGFMYEAKSLSQPVDKCQLLQTYTSGPIPDYTNAILYVDPAL